MSKIEATVVADSTNQQGDRLTSLLVTFPRIILAEVNTHRMLSKNTSSSRAIPFKKMVESVQNDPFIPIAWQKHHSGMQGSEYISTEEGIYVCNRGWLEARDTAVKQAMWMYSCNVTKQLCNRLLEPFMWTTMLITGSKEGWDNFFELRCPQYLYDYEDEPIYFKSKKDWVNYYNESQGYKENNKEFTKVENLTELEWLQINEGQAEIHIMDLAEKIYDTMNESTPKQLKAGEWHIPFGDKINLSEVRKQINIEEIYTGVPAFVKISTAMAARTSYTVVGDEKEINYERMIELHDRLISQDPPHSSPMEHCARAMSDAEYYSSIKTSNYPIHIPKSVEEIRINGGVVNYELYPQHKEYGKNIDYTMYGWCRNFRGFIQYRHLIENNLTQN